jgi:hypothetical protein
MHMDTLGIGKGWKSLDWAGVAVQPIREHRRANGVEVQEQTLASGLTWV